MKTLTKNKRSYRVVLVTVQKSIAGLLIVSGLLLAGAETELFEQQLYSCTAGLLLFIVGGYALGRVCKNIH